jgi:hypothetical protein
MHKQHLQNGMFMNVENFSIESKSKRGFEKKHMHVIITIESTTIVSSIFAIQLKLILMFFHMELISEFQNFIHSWRSATIAKIVINARGIGDNKVEKKLLIVNGKGEFHRNILAFGNNFRTKYDRLLEVYNGSQCVMLLIKNVTTTSKKDRYLRAQNYTILTKVVNEAIQVRLFQLHSKLSSAQPALKEVSLFPIICIIQCFFQIYRKNIK